MDENNKEKIRATFSLCSFNYDLLKVASHINRKPMSHILDDLLEKELGKYSHLLNAIIEKKEQQ